MGWNYPGRVWGARPRGVDGWIRAEGYLINCRRRRRHAMQKSQPD